MSSKRAGCRISQFQEKIGGSRAHGLDLLEISNNYCGVMDAFRGLKLIIRRDLGLI